jgi:hypothetical protein
VAAVVAAMSFFMYLYAGFSGDAAYRVFLVNLEGEPLLRTWKVVALAAPWLLAAGMITADEGALGVTIALAFSTVWGSAALITGRLLVDNRAGHEIAPNEMIVAQVVFPLVTCAAMHLLHWRRRGVRSRRARRMGLLYTQYFGINGSHFAWKVAGLQFVTVVVQAHSKLLLLGRLARDGNVSATLYWLHFGVLVLNATVMPALLMAKGFFTQRVLVCILDIGLDLFYLTCALLYTVVAHNSYTAIVPTNLMGFLSNLMPIVHIMSVARALESHGHRGGARISTDANTDEGDDSGKGLRSLSRKASVGFVCASLAAFGSVVLSDRSVYPFRKDVCAPCWCDDGVLVDCRPIGDMSHLYLNERDIRSVQAGAFEGLPSLFSLSLGENHIIEVQPGAFKGLSGLGNLKLQNNHIRELLPGCFEGLSGVDALFLQHNYIAEVHPGALEGLSELGRLSLEHNHIVEIQPGTFEGLSRLDDLRLHHNHIVNIAGGAFGGLQSLRQLLLLHNNITIRDVEFEGLNALEYLYFDNNHRFTCNSAQLRLPSLLGLSLGNVQLANCTAWYFSELANLGYLGLPRSSMTCDGVVVPASVTCEDGGMRTVCHESCIDAGNGACDDEDMCPLGTDCADCGPRV